MSIRFKPGDKVKRIQDFEQNRFRFSSKETYTISSHVGSYVTLIDVPHDWNDHKFKLVSRGVYLANNGEEINV